MWKNLLHIWSEDSLLKDSWQQSIKMLTISYDMLSTAIEVLRCESDKKNIKKTIRKIHEKDHVINAYLQEVRQKVLTHLAVHGKADLASGLVLLVIIIDIERIGDFSKNIVDLVELHPKQLDGSKFESALKKIEEAVKINFKNTKDCLEECDESGARDLLNEYSWVNSLCEKNLKFLVKEKDRKISSGDAAALALYFRWLKRINSHLRNILTSLINPYDRIGFKPNAEEENS